MCNNLHLVDCSTGYLIPSYTKILAVLQDRFGHHFDVVHSPWSRNSVGADVGLSPQPVDRVRAESNELDKNHLFLFSNCSLGIANASDDYFEIAKCLVDERDQRWPLLFCKEYHATHCRCSRKLMELWTGRKEIVTPIRGRSLRCYIDFSVIDEVNADPSFFIAIVLVLAHFKGYDSMISLEEWPKLVWCTFLMLRLAGESVRRCGKVSLGCAWKGIENEIDKYWEAVLVYSDIWLSKESWDAVLQPFVDDIAGCRAFESLICRYESKFSSSPGNWFDNIGKGMSQLTSSLCRVKQFRLKIKEVLACCGDILGVGSELIEPESERDQKIRLRDDWLGDCFVAYCSQEERESTLECGIMKWQQLLFEWIVVAKVSAFQQVETDEDYIEYKLLFSQILETSFSELKKDDWWQMRRRECAPASKLLLCMDSFKTNVEGVLAKIGTQNNEE